MIRKLVYRRVSDGNGGTKEEVSYVKAVGIPVLVAFLVVFATAAGRCILSVADCPAKAEAAMQKAQEASDKAESTSEQNRKDHDAINKKLDDILFLLARRPK